MYQPYVYTAHAELNGPSNLNIFPTGNRKIVGLSIQQSGTASQSTIKCGTGNNILAINYGKDFPFNEVNFDCNDVIRIEKTGQDSASFIISVYDINPSYPIPTSYFPQSIEFASASATAIRDTTYFTWFALTLIIFILAINLGTYIFKK